MKIIAIDYETYWSQTHSLTKITPPIYCMHPETELQSIAVKVEDEETFVLFGEDEIQAWADETDFSDVYLIGHNMSGFDCMLAAWRNNIKPAMWGCTLAMARPIHAKTAGGSLRALAEFYGLQRKGNIEKLNTKGKKLADFTAEEREAMRVYNKIDTDICKGLFDHLVKEMTRRELKVIDMTIRMTTEPKFVLNKALLEKTLEDENKRKNGLLLDIGWQLLDGDVEKLLTLDTEEGREDIRKQLASAPKFKKILEGWGVDTPLKQSPSNPEKMIPALAKTDKAFIELQDHADDRVAAAARARLNISSTILETRVKRFLDIGELLDNKMPIFLLYCGADTTWRWSGSMKLNQQNMPRVNGSSSDAIRRSLTAPPGYKIVSVDLSGIELRVNHFLWKVKSSMDKFKDDPIGADLYTEFAATLYKKPEETITKDERQVGKVAQLGLGFGAGAAAFKRVAQTMGGVILTDDGADRIKNVWRNRYKEISDGWRECGNALNAILYNNAKGQTIDPWGLCTVVEGGIQTPQGGMIRYPNLRNKYNKDKNQNEMIYGDKRIAKIYGSKCEENIVQHLARQVLVDYILAFAKTDLGKKYPLAHTVHDEVIYVVKEEDAEDVLQTIIDIMRGGVEWWPELITSAEGGIGDNYGDAH